MRRQSKGTNARAFFYGTSFHLNAAYQPKEPIMTTDAARNLATATQQDLAGQLEKSLEAIKPPFAITGPGEYQMRDGRKAVILRKGGVDWRGLEGTNQRSWLPSGSWSISETPTLWDIVGPWIAETIDQKQARIEKLASILYTIACNRDSFAEHGPEIEHTPDGLTMRDLAKLDDWVQNMNEAAWERSQRD